MTIKKIIFSWGCAVLLLLTSKVEAKQKIEIAPQEGDMTRVVREALESITDKEVVLVFEKGKYFFRSDYAIGKYCAVTNHDNSYKNIIFPLENFTSIEIQGNGAEFIFHGLIMPFRFYNCQKITVSNLTMDWDIPFNFQSKVLVVNEEEGWMDVQPFEEGYSWKLQRGKLNFPNIDGFTYSSLGSTLSFDEKEKRVTHGAWDHNLSVPKIEKRPKGVLRIHDKFKKYPPVGSILTSKGGKGENRYAPAIEVMSSKNVDFDGVVIHHALGMGFLFERTDGITISKSGVYLREGTTRVVSSTADATHFANCKGDILIENCRFENMLDDGTNVHGTYVEVNKIIDEQTAMIELKHFQQSGFQFAEAGDEVWFIHQPDPQRKTTSTITEVTTINERFVILKFNQNLPEGLKAGDIIENKTWNPSFTMRRCTIQNHRARNIVLKTPKKILIENNYFSSMMAAVFFRGETYYWFESGGVEDVLIRNNNFEYCAYSGNDQAVLYVTPRLGKTFDETQFFDRNIRFENNTIKNFNNRIVIADRVDGLTISGNKITETSSQEKPLINPGAALFTLTHCKNVKIFKNKYKGKHTKVMDVDSTTKSTLKVKKNKGFK